MLVTQAYRYALDPTPRQQGALASHCGAARFAYNWGLDLCKQRLDQRATSGSVEVPWTLPALQREGNRAKPSVAPWWAENSKEAYKSGLNALARALKNWSDSKAGRRAGRPMSFPHFKGKRRTRPSCRFTTGAIRVEPDRHHVVLPRLGRIRTHESTRKLAVASNAALPVSSAQRSRAPRTAGMSRSPSKSSVVSPSALVRVAWSAWMSASAIWPCCPPAR